MTPVGRDGFGTFLKPHLRGRLETLGLDVVYHRARGDHLYFDEDGEEVEVLDLVGGFGATLLGHNHPDAVAALRRVLDEERPFLAQGSVRAEAGRLARRLSERVGRVTGASYRVTLANSGTEAVEAALKHAELERHGRIGARLDRMRGTFAELEGLLDAGTARIPDRFLDQAGWGGREPSAEDVDALFARLRRRLLELRAEPPLALALEGAFHGKTLGAVQLTHDPGAQDHWRHLGPRVELLSLDAVGDVDAILERERRTFLDLEIGWDGSVALVPRHFVNVLACFVEPIQGEGGVRPVSDDALPRLRAAASTAGFPLVFDEIQTGMGRTGTFLASEPSGVRADYYTLAKSLGGGLAKISALLVDRDRYVDEFDSLHTSTYADDDASSAAGNAALDVIERDGGRLLATCRQKGDYLLDRLRALREAYPDQLADIRGRGLMVGVELASQEASPSRLLRVLSEQDRLGELVCGHLFATDRIRVLPTVSAGSTLRLEPSAFIERSELDRFCDALERVLKAMAEADVPQLIRFLVGEDPSTGGHEPPPSREPTRLPDPVALADADGHVGFLVHFPEPGDLRRWDPTLVSLSAQACARFLERTRGSIDPFVADRVVVRSATGTSVATTMIALPFTSAQAEEAMRTGDDAWILEWINDGVDLARRLGCTVLGFGGYTSIVTRSCRSVHAPGLAVTTGNALTAASALAATLRAADEAGIEDRRLGVVGATGNIGRVLAEVAVPKVSELLLVGKPGAARRLRPMAEALGADGRVRMGTSLDALLDCNLIISATNSARPVLLPRHVAPHGPVVVSDVAIPGDVDPRLRNQRPEATVLSGGIIRAPLGQELDLGGLGLRAGELYGCLAEAVILGLEGVTESFSRGTLEADRVHRIRELAERHGFSIDEPSLP